MKVFLRYFILCIFVVNSYALVPVDTSMDTAGLAAMASYTTRVKQTMQVAQQGMSVTKKLQSLQGLRKLQAGGDICRLCTEKDKEALQNYSNSINSDLCSQFNLAYQNLTGVQNAVDSLDGIMNLLTVNPQAAALSLQQASVAAQSTTNSTLAQIQLLQAQSEQKRLADEKLQKNNADEVGAALKDVHL